MNNQELDNWHDYEVESRREIASLLRQIGEKHQLVRMLIKGEADVCVTTVLDVDPDTNTMVLDRSIERMQNERIVEAGAVRCETSLDKIRILFSAENLRHTQFEGSDALRADIPAKLIRLQRREYYRMETPVSNPVRAIIPLPPELGAGTAVFPLHDISCGGIAILDNKLQLDTTIGTTIPNCRIELPEVGPVTVALQVRNSLDLTLLNNKTNRRIGLQFVDISRGGMAGVQRYITKLERERNARLAGLA
ncbi:flagellar brake protein [Massilia sp. IC2-477]|uniref:flagellar brake protein n=1 Tax=unclassified Massilia TaxID=2609279 RepID=UPI001D108C45|nr:MULTISPECIES: flagellar brake protein [unclassified Massilia]MCC2956994.1 flagellar brake protein [Massilia sp. IC2-477]MCC2970803.1 flagellar brake protein [Massilia sp. IC2-476]